VIVLGLVLAALAAALHVYIFVLESVLWTTPRARSTFGTTAGEAEATREMAFNQGFYNLFLAIVTVVGIVAVTAGATAVGAALVFAGSGSMVAAALVLLLSSPAKRRAALIQMAPGLLAAVVLAVGLAL
jgi:putative membrane protein